MARIGLQGPCGLRRKEVVETEQFEMIPKFNELMMPVFRAIKSLGGSGKNDEIINRVITDLNLPDDVVGVFHDGKSAELSYQRGCAKIYMKDYGILVNNKRSVWSITPDYTDVDTIDERDIVKSYKSKRCKSVKTVPDEKSSHRGTLSEYYAPTFRYSACMNLLGSIRRSSYCQSERSG